jgi:protease-4
MVVGGLTSKDKPKIEKKSVLVLNLGQHYKEQAKDNFLSVLSSNDDADIPGLYDVVRLLHKAKTDKNISGVYIIANSEPKWFCRQQ